MRRIALAVFALCVNAAMAQRPLDLVMQRLWGRIAEHVRVHLASREPARTRQRRKGR